MLITVLLLVVALSSLYNRTTIGLQARATMQKPDMARALGVTPDIVYLLTFSLGSGLAGLSGALLAPTTFDRTLHGAAICSACLHHCRRWGCNQRHRRRAWLQHAVVTGADTGRILASGRSSETSRLLLAALVIIRLMPDGISAAFQRWQDQRARMV